MLGFFRRKSFERFLVEGLGFLVCNLEGLLSSLFFDDFLCFFLGCGVGGWEKNIGHFVVFLLQQHGLVDLLLHFFRGATSRPR